MRSSYAIYRKLREVKFHYLTILYKKYLKKIPSNCKYNYLYKFEDNDSEYKIRLCLLHQKNKDNMDAGVYLNLIDVCQYESHCRQCNAFISRYTKENVREIFEKDLKENPSRYPEINALEWVLEKSIIGILPFNWIQSLFYIIKRFVTKNKMF